MSNYSRNRRMRKAQQAQAMGQSDFSISRNKLPLTVAVVNNSINPKNCSSLDSHKPDHFRDKWDKCYVCSGKKCGSIYMVGHCGCKYGIDCFDSTYLKECPTCSFKDPDSANGNFSRNFADVGQLASLAVEDLAKQASNFITSMGVDKGHLQSVSRLDNRPQTAMNQGERDAVIRNVQIAKTVAATTATVTGHMANNMGSCLLALGGVLSPVVRSVSKQILSGCNVDKEKTERMVNEGMEIAKSAITTTGSLTRGVQCGAGILASGVCSRLAQHYESIHGFQPGEIQSDVGEIVENVLHTAWNLRAIHPKSKLTKISRIPPSHESGNSLVEM